MSEKRSFSITDEQTSLWYTGEFVKEVQKWKLTVAVSAQVDTSPTAQRRLARRVPKVAENRGKRAFLDSIPESQQRASLDPASPDWDFFMIPESQQPSYGRLESKTKLVLIVASLLCAVLVLEAVVQLPNVEVILGSWKERLLLLGIMVSTTCFVRVVTDEEPTTDPHSLLSLAVLLRRLFYVLYLHWSCKNSGILHPAFQQRNLPKRGCSRPPFQKSMLSKLMRRKKLALTSTIYMSKTGAWKR
jgi:hypothetical protein